jgi:hypothetical protein
MAGTTLRDPEILSNMHDAAGNVAARLATAATNERRGTAGSNLNGHQGRLRPPFSIEGDRYGG